MSPAAPIERLLRHDRALTLSGLLVLCALTWLYVVGGAGLGMPAWEMTTLSPLPRAAGAPAAPMPEMPMAGMAMPASGPAFADAAYWALLVAMWFAMMVAMMVPGAAPAILLFARVQRHAEVQVGAPSSALPAGQFAAAYLVAWLAFSILAASLQLLLQRAGVLADATMASRLRWLSGAVLVAAGAYQFTPFKHACLAHCRSPAAFLAHHWRPGRFGAWRLGLRHGMYCLGCCWVLMALLFVGGVMNLLWIGALTALVLVEKLAPGGRGVARVAGLAMIAWGVLVLVAH